jgi:hypothetical protein
MLPNVGVELNNPNMDASLYFGVFVQSLSKIPDFLLMFTLAIFILFVLI